MHLIITTLVLIMMEERQAMEGYAQLDIFVLKDQKHHFSAQLVNIVLIQS